MGYFWPCFRCPLDLLLLKSASSFIEIFLSNMGIFLYDIGLAFTSLCIRFCLQIKANWMNVYQEEIINTDESVIHYIDIL